MMKKKPTAPQAVDYQHPDVPAKLDWVEMRLVRATPGTLRGYGELVDNYLDFPIEIVRWPAQGWRPVDAGTGDEAGTTRGTFECWWEGDVLCGRNGAVGGEYVLGWSKNPGEAVRDAARREFQPRVLLWHANYHPDGGQLFFPLDGTPFVVPLALPGDDVRPEYFVAFYFDGTQGLYIHPNVWHEGVFPTTGQARFHDEQGKVHARVSCFVSREFKVFLSAPLTAPSA